MVTDRELDRRALAVLEQVLDLSAEQREVELPELCRGDDDLQRRVLVLLERSGSGDLEVASNPNEIDSLLRASAPLPVQGDVGGYEIVRLIGRGGMGEVYEARQRAPARTVAIKVLRQGLLGADARRRFVEEARLLAHLDHPGIARVIESGVHLEQTPTGGRELPFLVLEHVAEARSITDYADHMVLSHHDRVELLIAVARAVHHGHQKGVIHRDLKPANLLVGADGRPKVIDFGVARVVDGDLQRPTLVTQVGQIVGTLGFIAPELLAGEIETADVQSDVYALGAVAFRLCVGAPPFDLEETALAEAASRVTGGAPRRPRDLEPAIDADLEAILLQAIARHPADRYGSALELAADLERWQRNETIIARRPTIGRRFQLFVRRDPRLAISIGTIVALVVLGALVFAFVQNEARRDSEAKARQIAVAKEEADFRLYVASAATAQTALQRGDLALAQHHLALAPAAYRNFEWEHLHHVASQSVQEFAIEPTATLLSEEFHPYIAVHPDGERVVVAAARTIRVFDLATGEMVEEVDHSDRFRGPPMFQPGGESFVVLVPEARGEDLWRMNPLAPSRRLLRRKFQSLAISPDGEHAVATNYRTLCYSFPLAAPTDEQLVELAESGARVAWPSACPDRCLILGHHGLSEFEPASRRSRSVREFERMAEKHLVVTSDGRHAVVVNGRAVSVVEVESGETIWAFDLPSAVGGLAIGPSDRRLVVGLQSGALLVCDLERHEQLRSMPAHAFAITSIAFHPDERRLLTAGLDNRVRVWDLGRRPAVARIDRHIGPLPRGDGEVAIDVRSEHVASRGSDDVVRLFRAADLGPTTAVLDDGDVGSLFDFDPVTGGLVTAGPGAEIRVRDLDELETVKVIECGHRPQGLAFSPDGGRCLLRRSSRVFMLRWPTGEIEWLQRPRPKLRARAMAWSGDGTRVAIGFEGEVLELDALDGRVVRTFDHGATVRVLCFLPGGDRLASAGDDGVIRVWNTTSGAAHAELRGHSATIRSLEVAPTGDRLLSAAEDGLIKLWDVVRLEQVFAFPKQVGWVQAGFVDGGRAVIARTVGGDLLRFGVAAEVASSVGPAIAQQAAALLARHGRDLDAALGSLGPEERDSELARYLRVLRGEPEFVLAHAWRLACDSDAGYRAARGVVARMSALANERNEGLLEVWLLRAFANYRHGHESRVNAAESTLNAPNVRAGGPRLEQARLAFLALVEARRGNHAEAVVAAKQLGERIESEGLRVPESLLGEVRATTR